MALAPPPAEGGEEKWYVTFGHPMCISHVAWGIGIAGCVA